jgi:hypothetical protein
VTTSRLVPLALPHTMPGGSRVDLQFSASATVGVTLDYVRHKVGGNYDFISKLVDASVTNQPLDGRLWEVGYTLRPFTGTEGNGTVSPKDARSFAAYDVSLAQGTAAPAEALLFVWKGVAIPGGDTISVSMMVRLDTDEFVSRWWTWVTREHGQSASIDYVEGPILWIKGPALPNGGESHLNGQKRARVLLATAGLTPVLQTNSSIYDWALTGLSHTAVHPNPGQIMQFFAIASMNSIATPDPAYRRCLYMGTEDTQGWYKEYTYRGYLYTGGGATDGYFRWAVRHRPPFQKMVGNESADDWRGSWAQSYPVVVGALQADADSFWYDVAMYYRSRVEALGFVPPKVESNTRLQSAMARKPSLFFPVIDIGAFEPSTRSAANYFQNCLALLRTIRKALKSKFITEDYAVLHFQNWMGPNGFNHGPPEPLVVGDPTYAPSEGITQLIIDAAGDGIRVSAYSLPHEISAKSGWLPTFPERGFFFQRSGAIAPALTTTIPGMDLDLGASELLQWWKRVTYRIRALGFGSIYLDAYSGGGPKRTFPQGGHPRGGGNYGMPNKAALVDTVRTIMRRDGSDMDAPVLSEAAEEGMIGYFEFIGPPGSQQTLLAESTIRGAVTDLPTAARYMNPDLYGAVYHEYAPGSHLGMPWSNSLLATNADWWPSNGKLGLSAAEFNDVVCFTHGIQIASGTNPATPVYQAEFEGWDPAVTSHPSGISNGLVLPDTRGTGWTVDATKDPSKCGVTCTDFLRILFETMIRNYGGQFLQFGRFQRPITVNYASVNVTRQNNPYSVFTAAAGKVDRTNINRYLMFPTELAVATAVPALEFISEASYEVPAVFSSMWVSPEGLLGLVLCNWTNAAASWIGSLDTTLYPTLVTPYNVNRLVLGGAATPLAAAVPAGVTTIGTTGSGATIDLGTLPARSTAVITFG